MLKQCNACGGIYEPIGPDGVAYYHVCAPITLVPVIRNSEAQLVPLADLLYTDIIVVQRGPDRVRVLVGDMKPDDMRLGDVHAQRENHRDETPIAQTIGEKVVSRAKEDGVGATEITVAPLTGLEVLEHEKPFP